MIALVSCRAYRNQFELPLTNPRYHLLQLLLVFAAVPTPKADPSKPHFTIVCPDLPEAAGIYELEFEDQYRMLGGPNTLTKHPMDNVWCVSNGNYFILSAVDTAVDPVAVKEWKIRIKNKMVATSTVVVSK